MGLLRYGLNPLEPVGAAAAPSESPAAPAVLSEPRVRAGAAVLPRAAAQRPLPFLALLLRSAHRRNGHRGSAAEVGCG